MATMMGNECFMITIYILYIYIYYIYILYIYLLLCLRRNFFNRCLSFVSYYLLLVAHKQLLVTPCKNNFLLVAKSLVTQYLSRNSIVPHYSNNSLLVVMSYYVVRFTFYCSCHFSAFGPSKIWGKIKLILFKKVFAFSLSLASLL